MAKIQDIDIPYLEFAEAAAPGTPASGIVRTYAKSDGLMYSKDDAGTETVMSGGGGGSSAFAGCLVQRTTDQTGVVTATDTPVVFNGTDISDTNGYHNPGGANPERITIPSGGDGYYIFHAYVIWDNASATGFRRIALYKNGSSLVGGGGVTTQGQSATFYEQQTSSWGPISAVAGDYFTVVAHQTSGGNRTLSGSIVPLTFGCTFQGT